MVQLGRMKITHIGLPQIPHLRIMCHPFSLRAISKIGALKFDYLHGCRGTTTPFAGETPTPRGHRLDGRRQRAVDREHRKRRTETASAGQEKTETLMAGGWFHGVGVSPAKGVVVPRRSWK
ncbi:Uncharacterized protein Fot_32740 [Forsythia ovata]|uniref:Uncharacterized protein n=1 Tax=Forsythia ovata TaxID=205694 RepID=A0ABD1T964_9LAMI